MLLVACCTTILASAHGLRTLPAMVAAASLPLAMAYVPAVPVNDTSGLNLTDNSGLSLKWKPDVGSAGFYSVSVSYQLAADYPTGIIDAGALVHFTEEGAGDNITTSTPWIAMIECRNWTHASDYWDVFTLARDRGAIAALLYTTIAQSCLINEDYLENFEKPLDVFATKSMSSAKLIEQQFNYTDTLYWQYNETLLNQSFQVVNDSLASNSVASKTFLIATLVPKVAQGQASTYPSGITATASANRPSKPNKATSPGMIALYCIVGVVVLSFISLLLLGAIRAHRYPERYGPNAEFGGRPPPASTAAGIGHAILDTFPVIKFNRTPRTTRNAVAYPSYGEDGAEDEDVDSSVGSTMHQYKMRDLDSPMEVADTKGNLIGHRIERVSSSTLVGSGRMRSPPSSPTLVKDPEIAAAAAAFAAQRKTMIKNQMAGREKRRSGEPVPTPSSPKERAHEEDEDEQGCPICLLDFEEGDDVRVLPCQLAHSFHKECIDPWLLEVSSSCPLCRKDFANHDTQAATTAVIPEEPDQSPPGSIGERPGRFVRYLTFVRGERRRNHDVENETRRERRRRRREERWEQSGPGPF